MSAQLAIEAADGAITRCSLLGFLEDNEALDDAERAQLLWLGVGESMKFGGGAGPLLVVRRIA